MPLRPALEVDLPALVAIEVAAVMADGVDRCSSVADLQLLLRHPGRILPGQVLTVAEIDGTPVGFHRLGAFSQPDGLAVYTHRGHVLPAYRGRGVGTMLLTLAEERLAALAAAETPAHWVLSSWHYEREQSAANLLVPRGYGVHRTMLEMRRSLMDELPTVALPPGVGVRPVHPGQLGDIWEAYVDAQQDDLGSTSATQAAYEKWCEAAQDTSLWSVAWAGDRVVGMVLNNVSEDENGIFERARAYTEDIMVTRRWRRRGVAAGLLCQSLQRLRDDGFSEAVLDVNAANPSNAARLYGRLGYVATSGLAIRRNHPLNGQVVC